MLDPHLFAAFCVATALLILIPGPIVSLVVADSFDGAYALLAGRLRPWLVGHARVRHGITGTLLVGTGVGIALVRRS